MKMPEKAEEPKVVTGLWLADARQETLERAEACPVMILSSGEEHESFKGAKTLQEYYIKCANEFADRLEALVEQ